MMLQKYLLVFLVSMVPMIELRGAVLLAPGLGLPMLPSYLICILGNMLPVPFIHLFARKVLTWGALFSVVPGKRAPGRRETQSKSRQGAVFGSDAVRSHPHSRHRRLDRDPGRQLPGHGIQAHRPGRFDGSGHCRYHHDPGGDRRICRIFLPIAGFHVSHTNREKPQFPGISLDFFVHISIHRIKLVGVTGSRSGAGRAAASRQRRIQARLRARVRMVCKPSRSWATSCGVLPWTWFQY